MRIGNAQDLMLRNRAPKTALEAKFSIEFAMASALIARQVGLKELDDDFVRRDDIVETMRKVKRSTTEERMADMPPSRRTTASASASRTARRSTHEPVVRPKGQLAEAADRGRAAREVPRLHRSAGSGRKQAEALFDKLNNLEDVKSLRELPLVKM